MSKVCSRINRYNKVFIPEDSRPETKYVELEVNFKHKSKCFIAVNNSRITVRKFIRESLGLEHQDDLNLKISPVENRERSGQLIRDGKVDLLYLVPKFSSNGDDIVVSEFEKSCQSWLRIWYQGGSKGTRPIEIKRFVCPRALGEILGQYQAEGEKSRNSRLVFSNKLVEEHKDFASNILEIGLTKNMIKSLCAYNPEMVSEGEVEEYLEMYNQETNLEVQYSSEVDSRGPKSIKTIIRNGPISELIFNSMNVVRTRATKKVKSESEKELVAGYLAKLLTGDGTLDTTVSPSRKYGSPSINIKIVDKNQESLQDYKRILEQAGFKPSVNKENIYVRSSCSLDNLIYLYRREAFKNTQNWEKLALSVAIILEGRRYSTYKRLIDLYEEKTFSGSTIEESYNVGHRAALDWISNKQNEDLIKCVRESPYPKRYRLTEKGYELASTLQQILEKADKIKKRENVDDYLDALDCLKE